MFKHGMISRYIPEPETGSESQNDTQPRICSESPIEEIEDVSHTASAQPLYTSLDVRKRFREESHSPQASLNKKSKDYPSSPDLLNITSKDISSSSEILNQGQL